MIGDVNQYFYYTVGLLIVYVIFSLIESAIGFITFSVMKEDYHKHKYYRLISMLDDYQLHTSTTFLIINKVINDMLYTTINIVILTAWGEHYTWILGLPISIGFILLDLVIRILSLQYTESIFLVCIWPIYGITICAKYLSYIIHIVPNFIRKLFRFQNRIHNNTTDFVRKMILGNLNSIPLEDCLDFQMVRRIIKMKEMHISDTMFHRRIMVNIDWNDTLNEILYTLDKNIGEDYIFIYRNNKEDVFAVIDTKLYLENIVKMHYQETKKYQSHESLKQWILDSCSFKPYFVSEYSNIYYCLNLLKSHELIIIVNEFGNIIGFITHYRLLQYTTYELYSEEDIITEELGRFIVPINLDIRTVNAQLQYELPVAFITIGNFVNSLRNRYPESSVLKYKEYTIWLDLKKHIKRIMISKYNLKRIQKDLSEKHTPL